SYTKNGETWTYSSAGTNQRSKKDSAGHTWLYTYDQSGRVTTDQDPAGQHRTRGFDTLGSPTSVTDEAGVATYYYYNNLPYYTLRSRWLDVGGPLEVHFDYTYDSQFPDKVTSVVPHRPDGTLNVDWQARQFDYYQAADSSPGSLHHVY